MKQSYIRGADLVGFRVRMVRDARGVVRLAGEEDEGEVVIDEPLGDYLKRLARGTAEPPPASARSRALTQADLTDLVVRVVADDDVLRLAREGEAKGVQEAPLGVYMQRLAGGAFQLPIFKRSGILLYTWDELEALVGELLRSFDHLTPALLRALSDRCLAYVRGSELVESEELRRLLQLGERELLARGYTVASSPFDQVF